MKETEAQKWRRMYHEFLNNWEEIFKDNLKRVRMFKKEIAALKSAEVKKYKPHKKTPVDNSKTRG